MYSLDYYCKTEMVANLVLVELLLLLLNGLIPVADNQITNFIGQIYLLRFYVGIVVYIDIFSETKGWMIIIAVKLS